MGGAGPGIFRLEEINGGVEPAHGLGFHGPKWPNGKRNK